MGSRPPSTSLSRIPFIEREFGAPLSKEYRINFKPHLVFVMMSFEGQEMEDTYTAIRDECENLGLNAARVDENVGSSFVIKEVATMINEAEFIVCDLTYERPNVYYELGYAHGVGNHAYNILLIAKQGTKLHFDIAPLRVQYYDSGEDLRNIVRKNLGEMRKISQKINAVSTP